VDEPARTALAAWESFYIIVGSSAGALTGLQFVVIALIADSKTPSSSPEIAAFGTHYGFTDLDGSQPDAWRYMVEVQDAGRPADVTGYR
jgi:hypothetical protein